MTATVLFLHSSAGRYGADRQLLLLCAGLTRHRAHVVLPSAGPLADDLVAAGVGVTIRPGLAVLRRELLTPGGAVSLARAAGRDARGLRVLARRVGAGLVHSNTSVILGGFFTGLPHVVHVREIYSGFGPLWPAWRAVLRRADALVAVSEATAAPLGPGAQVVHDGLAAAPVPAPRDEARDALGLPRDAFVAAVLGRISGWKGQAVLARALAEVPGAIGIVAGDAWPGQERWEDELRAEASALGLGDRLRLIGFREDVETVYGAADVVVVPSTLPDPFPNAALEALAAGCCVVASAHGGLEEMIGNRVNGRLFPPGEHARLARLLRELREDPAQVARLGAAGARFARRFDAAGMVGRVEAIYDDLPAGR